MFPEDDLDPKFKVRKPKDLSKHSVDELDDYVASLKEEIIRVEDEKKKKIAQRDIASNFFKPAK
jgi:uncharacterized small protein (DUF1192 family)